MSVHRLFAILVALAVLVAPGVTSAAMAASSPHDMQMMEPGHCDAPPSSAGDHDKMDGKSCCIPTCTAVAVAPSASLLDYEVAQAPAVFVIAALHLAYLGEIATPPPRRS